MAPARCPGAIRDLAIGRRNVALKSNVNGCARITGFPEAPWHFAQQKQKLTETEAEESMLRKSLINTPLQRGDWTSANVRNRSSGFSTLNHQPSTKLCLNQFD